MRKIVSVQSFFKQISRQLDDYNNQHSPQQGVGKLDYKYMHVVRHAQAVAIIKSVWKHSQMIITQEPNQTQNQLGGYWCTRACVRLLHWIHKVLSTDAFC